MPATTPSSRRRRAAASSSDPKRSEFSSAIGRAPIVKMSRRMPPTPVAAPWYGSMNDGWLCDSILKTAAQAVADVDGAGVLAGPLQHARPVGRQRLQVHARALVAAVLGPHHREDAELGEVRLAAEERDDALVLVGREAVAFEDVASIGHRSMRHRRLDGRPSSATACRVASAATTDSKITSPSALPSDRLARALGMRHQARRRCAASLQMPAMLSSEPFGFAASVTSPVGVA